MSEDLFVLMQNGRPGVSRMLRQAHARKNHSYFLVFIKPDGKKRWTGVTERLKFEEPQIAVAKGITRPKQPTLFQ